MTRFQVICFLAASLQTAVGQQPQTYHDPVVHLTLTYPAGYINRATGGPIVLSSGAAGDIQRCTVVPLAAVHSHDRLFDMVMVYRLDLTCAKLTLGRADLGSFADAVLRQSLAAHGKVSAAPGRTLKLGGHDAIYLEGSVDESAKAPNQTLHAGLLCSIMHDNAVCLQALSYDPAVLTTLLALPLSLEGAPAAPMFPPGIRTQ